MKKYDTIVLKWYYMVKMRVAIMMVHSIIANEQVSKMPSVPYDFMSRQNNVMDVGLATDMV